MVCLQGLDVRSDVGVSCDDTECGLRMLHIPHANYDCELLHMGSIDVCVFACACINACLGDACESMLRYDTYCQLRCLQ